MWRKEKPRAKQRGAFLAEADFDWSLLERLAELFSSLFYVAASCLNSPRLFEAVLNTSASNHVKAIATPFALIYYGFGI